MDGLPPADVSDHSGPEADEWMAVFKAKLVAVEEAAREWGLRWQEPEGRFVSALLGAIAMLGDLSRAAQGSIEAMARQHREAAALELAGAKEITRAAEVSLRQARQAQISLVVEKENLTLRMIKETLPLFVERLKEALIIREKRWNDDVKRRRLATAGLVTLGLVLGGYGLHMWQSWDATSAFDWCLWHQLQGNGHIYCDLTDFRQSHP